MCDFNPVQNVNSETAVKKSLIQADSNGWALNQNPLVVVSNDLFDTNVNFLVVTHPQRLSKRRNRSTPRNSSNSWFVSSTTPVLCSK